VLVRCGVEVVERIAAGLDDQDSFSLFAEPDGVVLERLRRLHRRALPRRDHLTGLFDRRYFMHQLREMCQVPGDQPLSLILADVDHFKVINDEHGPTRGDQTLKAIAARIAASSPPDVLLARVGGQEFALLIAASQSDANHMAERMGARVRSEPAVGVPITISTGVATRGRPMSPSELYRQSDQALYAAKARGRDQTVHFSDLERAAIEGKRDLALESFQNRTRILSERAARQSTRHRGQFVGDLRCETDLDALTGLYSRPYLERRLPRELDIATRDNQSIVVALLDVDHLGRINKEHGWPCGDRVLADIAQRVQSEVRSTDWVARYEGGELCVVMHDASIERAQVILERLLAHVESDSFVTPAGLKIQVTASVGAVQYQGDEDFHHLINDARNELLGAKRAGGNRVSLRAQT
jgi:diguanylate cyclase (GGDEF)-like protein